jgi:GLPGLI family protein
MKKILFIFLVLSGYQIQAKTYNGENKPVDHLMYKCTYILTYQLDSTDKYDIRSEKMLLNIGSHVSMFLSQNTYLRDSIANQIKNMDRAEITLALNNMSAFPKSDFKFQVYKNYPKDKITTVDKIFTDNFIYEEPMDLFNWKILPDTTRIAGYLCQKATTGFSGRYYTAWFTPNIPISEGPYKFHGLPGLILRITDSKGYYDFNLISLTKTEDGEIVFPQKSYIKTSKAAFFKTLNRFNKGFAERMEQSGFSLDDPQEKQRVREKLLKRNNPIELY